MKTAAYFTPKNIMYTDMDIPQINKDEVLIKVKAVGVCGSDLLKIERDLVPDGTVLGHEVSGDIVKRGENVENFTEGARVVVAHHAPCFRCHYCMRKSYSMCETFKKTNLYPGGFSEYVKIQPYLVQHTLFKIPDNLSYEEAIFMEPLACCTRAMGRINHKPGDTVAVMGLGVAGLLFVELCNFFNTDVIGFDLLPERLNMALRSGAKKAENNKEDLKKSIMEISDNRGADLIILAAGNGDLVNLAISLVRDGGTVLIFSSSHQDYLNINFNDIYFRELSLITGYSSSPDDLKYSLKLLEDGKINVKDFISEPLPLSECQKGIDMAFNREVLKVIFKM